MQSIRDNNLKEWELADFFDDKLQYRRLFPTHVASAITRIVYANRPGFFNRIIGWFKVGVNGGYPTPTDTLTVCKYLRNDLKIKPSTILEDPEYAEIHMRELDRFFQKKRKRKERVMSDTATHQLSEEEAVDTATEATPEAQTEESDQAQPARNPFVITVSRKEVDLKIPDPDSITEEDLAHHLSLIYRYNGVAEYSVLRHSLELAKLVERMPISDEDEKTELMLWALLHDASEAYLGDVVSPLKGMLLSFDQVRDVFLQHLFPNDDLRASMENFVEPLRDLIPGYRDIEANIMKVIAEKYGLRYPRPAIIKDLEQTLMAAEMLQVSHWPERAASVAAKPADVVLTYKPWFMVKEEFLEMLARLKAKKTSSLPSFSLEVSRVHDQGNQEAA